MTLGGRLQLPALFTVSLSLTQTVDSASDVYRSPRHYTAGRDSQTLPVSGELQVVGGSDDGLHPAGSLQPHVPPGGLACPTGTTLIAANKRHENSL